MSTNFTPRPAKTLTVHLNNLKVIETGELHAQFIFNDGENNVFYIAYIPEGKWETQYLTMTEIENRLDETLNDALKRIRELFKSKNYKLDLSSSKAGDYQAVFEGFFQDTVETEEKKEAEVEEEETEVEEDTVAETPTTTTTEEKAPMSITDQLKENATVQAAGTAVTKSAKTVAAMQAQRAFQAAIRKAIEQAIPKEHLAVLDAPAVDAILSIMTPMAVHFLAANYPNVVPKAAFVQSAAEHALEGQMIRHGYEYSTVLADFLAEIAGPLKELATAGALQVEDVDLSAFQFEQEPEKVVVPETVPLSADELTD